MTTLEMPKGFRLERGLMWPERDFACAAVIFKMKDDLAHVLPFVKDRGCCVQAGGNCGVFARELAPEFGAVYTFEPHPENFTALAHNTAEFKNVIRIQSCIGFNRKLVSMELDAHEEDNHGAFFAKADTGGILPTLCIDDLNIKPGLIYLDIEGMEIPALHGAAGTIMRARPVIALEDKGLSEKYGFKQGDAVKYLTTNFGYKLAKKVHRDVILVPEC